MEGKELVAKFLVTGGKDWEVKDIDDTNGVVAYVGRKLKYGWEIARVFEDVELRWFIANHKMNKGLGYRSAWKNRTSLVYRVEG